MASTRPMRKSSRMSSPLDVSTKDSTTPPNEQAKKERKTFMDSWVEPPLRNPAPSFEDYKGLERHGVLEHMAPLGSLPTQKVKLRVKAEAPKRLMQVKNDDPAAAKEGARTPEALPTVTTRRSESRKAEDRPLKNPPSRVDEGSRTIHLSQSHPSSEFASRHTKFSHTGWASETRDGRQLSSCTLL